MQSDLGRRNGTRNSSFCKWQKKTRYQGKETMIRQMAFRVSAATVASAWGLGRRTLTTGSKALGRIDRLKGGKSRTSSSELCKYLGIPDQTRSDKALIISKFLKLYNLRVRLQLSLSLSTALIFLNGKSVLRVSGLFCLQRTNCLINVLTQNMFFVVSASVTKCLL